MVPCLLCDLGIVKACELKSCPIAGVYTKLIRIYEGIQEGLIILSGFHIDNQQYEQTKVHTHKRTVNNQCKNTARLDRLFIKP